jgi:HAD superfamily hydrolase (TIGR01549 family)
MWRAHRLDRRNHWVFDMDGTLTTSAHDFEFIRNELGLESKVPILEALNSMPTQQAAPLWERLNELECHFAGKSTLMPGVPDLLDKLQTRGAKLGILTRNTMPVVETTLDACGIGHYFPAQHRLDRDSCTPKPSPAGINYLLNDWQADASDAVMVGDYVYDLQAGKSANVATIHIDPAGDFAWPEVSDICIRKFSEIDHYL